MVLAEAVGQPIAAQAAGDFARAATMGRTTLAAAEIRHYRGWVEIVPSYLLFEEL